jgi:murein DD-endopeptidase MepM/ murein hydrolase activator NlpD
MFKKKAKHPSVKSIRELVNHKSHVQKKYFSLMLVPSYSTGKTRSVRIPYGVFYFIIISVLLISSVIAGFYIRSDYFRRLAHGVSAELDQEREAYIEMETSLTYEQNRLQDNAELLQSQLSEEQNRFQTEKSQVRQEYQGSLEELQDLIYDLELKLQELDETRLEVISQLGVKAYIPPIQKLVNDLNHSQAMLLSALGDVRIGSDERNPSVKTTEGDLRDYFTLLTARMDAYILCFTDLTRFGGRIKTYAANYPTRWPVWGQITSGFGYRTNPMGGGRGEHHDGIDIRVPTGTNVLATGGGTVRQAGWQGSYGYIVVIDHGSGIQTAYAHNSRILVSVGQRVERGEVIARSGSTGRSTGPHVHYEVRVNGKYMNPRGFFLD